MRRSVVIAAVVALAPAARAQPAPPTVAPADLAAATAAAVAAADPSTAAAGAATVVARVGATPSLDALRRDLPAALVAAGLTVIDPGDATGALRLTVADGRDVRALVTLDADGGQVVVIARPSRARAPGRCVAVPAVRWTTTVHSAGIDWQGQVHRDDTAWTLTTERLADVDGDGVLDAFVPRHRPGDCPETGRYDVYVMRGACGHRVGRLGPGWPDAATATAAVDGSGFRPLSFTATASGTAPNGTLQRITTVTRFHMGPRGYVRDRTRTTTDTCDDCGGWSCSAP